MSRSDLPGARPPTDGLAMAALVCSVMGLLCFVPAIAGVVLGVRSRRRIDAAGGVLGGRPLAVAAVWIGSILLAAYVLFSLYRFVY